MAASASYKRRRFDLLLARGVLVLAGLVTVAGLAISAIAPELAQRAAVNAAAPAQDKAAKVAAEDAALQSQRVLDVAREVQAAIDQALAASARGQTVGAEGRQVLARAQAIVRERPTEIVRQRTPQGDLYLGLAQNGVPEGYGLVRRAAGGIAASFFIAGESRGVGVSCAREDCAGVYYFGDYRHGEPTGFGVGAAGDGGLYRGEFKAGAPDGYGEYTFGDGAVYRGGFANGARQGFGALTLPNGQIQAGFWSNNALTIAAPPNFAEALAQKAAADAQAKAAAEQKTEAQKPAADLKPSLSVPPKN